MLVPTLHVGARSVIGPLSVFPVWADPGPAISLATPGEAELTVTEADTVSVGHLLVSNAGTHDALLLDGEVLEGGKQHRVLAADVIILARHSLTIDVACVEHGRWSEGHEHRRTTRRASARVREALLLRQPGPRQQQVWQRVAGYDGLSASPTESLVDGLDFLAEPHRRRAHPVGPSESAVDEAITALGECRPLPGQNGFLVGVAAQPLLLELFADPATLSAHLAATLTGVLMDAVAAQHPWTPTPGRRARRMAARVSGLDLATVNGADTGAGRSFQHTGEHTAIRGTEFQGVWAHLTALTHDHALLDA